MTNEFLVRYASGVETTIHSTCASVDEFCNDHFGSTWDEAKANGASVTMAGDAPAEVAPEVAPEVASEDAVDENGPASEPLPE